MYSVYDGNQADFLQGVFQNTVCTEGLVQTFLVYIARFFLVHDNKTGKISQMSVKYSERPYVKYIHFLPI
jgi:hypothetical protein